MTDNRSGTFLVRDQAHRIVAVWSSVWTLDRQLQPDQGPAKCRVQVQRTWSGVPVVCPKIHGHGSYLKGKTLRRFETETGLMCQSVERGLLEQMAETEYSKPWVSLAIKQRLELLDAVVCLYTLH